jgi:hypothetical protein
MSKLTNAIKKAAVALQVTAMGHENPAPVEGTQAATIIPVAPSEERDLAEAKTNAAKVITQLARTAGGYVLSQEDRDMVIANLNRFGPPVNAFQVNKNTGVATNLEGSPYKSPKSSEIAVSSVNVSAPGDKRVPSLKIETYRKEDDGGREMLLRYGVDPDRNQKRNRLGYLHYKSARKP